MPGEKNWGNRGGDRTGGDPPPWGDRSYDYVSQYLYMAAIYVRLDKIIKLLPILCLSTRLNRLLKKGNLNLFIINK